MWRANQKRYGGPSHKSFFFHLGLSEKHFIFKIGDTFFFRLPVPPYSRFVPKGVGPEEKRAFGPDPRPWVGVRGPYFGKTFTQLGLNFPKIWTSNSLPLFRCA